MGCGEGPRERVEPFHLLPVLAVGKPRLRVPLPLECLRSLDPAFLGRRDLSEPRDPSLLGSKSCHVLPGHLIKRNSAVSWESVNDMSRAFLHL